MSNAAPRMLIACIALLGAAIVGCSAPDPRTSPYVRFCSMLKSCEWSVAPSVAVCVDEVERAYAGDATAGTATGFSGLPRREIDHAIACAQNSNTCGTFYDCLTRNNAHAFCPGTARGTCSGDTLVFCAGWSIDCHGQGLVCRSSDLSWFCGDGSACDAMTPSTCEGAVRRICDAATGQMSVEDCSADMPGWTCALIDGAPRCVPPGAACSAAAARCEGNTLVSCDVTLSREVSVDCRAQNGGRCVVTNGVAACVPPATECTTATPDSCAGNRLQTCVDGRLVTFDCASTGMPRCLDVTPAGVGVFACSL